MKLSERHQQILKTAYTAIIPEIILPSMDVYLLANMSPLVHLKGDREFTVRNELMRTGLALGAATTVIYAKNSMTPKLYDLLNSDDPDSKVSKSVAGAIIGGVGGLGLGFFLNDIKQGASRIIADIRERKEGRSVIDAVDNAGLESKLTGEDFLKYMVATAAAAHLAYTFAGKTMTPEKKENLAYGLTAGGLVYLAGPQIYDHIAQMELTDTQTRKAIAGNTLVGGLAGALGGTLLLPKAYKK